MMETEVLLGDRWMAGRWRASLLSVSLITIALLMVSGCSGFFTDNTSTITVTPINPNVLLSTGKLQFTALSTPSGGGNPTDLTASVTWVSSNTAVATISNTAGSQGLATLVAAGTTTITASSTASGTTPGSTTLTVTQ